MIIKNRRFKTTMETRGAYDSVEAAPEVCGSKKEADRSFNEREGTFRKTMIKERGRHTKLGIFAGDNKKAFSNHRKTAENKTMNNRSV